MIVVLNKQLLEAGEMPALCRNGKRLNRGDKSDTATLTYAPEQEVGDTILRIPLPGFDQEG